MSALHCVGKIIEDYDRMIRIILLTTMQCTLWFPPPSPVHQPMWNIPQAGTDWNVSSRYDSMSDLGEIRVYQRADFQSGSRVLKKVFWTLSYLYLWHTMWFHAKKLLRTLKFWKSLNSLCKSGSRPQKSPKKAQKTDHSIAIYSNF